MKLDMEHQTAKLPDFWWDQVKTCCFVTLKMSYGFNCSLEGRRFVKLLFERKQMNATDRSVLPFAANTEEALEVLRPTSKDGSVISEEVLSIRTVQ